MSTPATACPHIWIKYSHTPRDCLGVFREIAQRLSSTRLDNAHHDLATLMQIQLTTTPAETW